MNGPNVGVSFGQHVRRRNFQHHVTAEKSSCLYCNERLPRPMHRQHRAMKHVEVEFRCLLCFRIYGDFATGGNYPRFFELKNHLKADHGLVADDQTPFDLSSNGIVALPADPRSTKCRICAKEMLAQDRLGLAAHIRYRHNLAVEKRELKYSCRICGQEFANTRIFSNHPCMSDTNNSPEIEQGGSKGSIPCVYCQKQISRDEQASHRSQHSGLDFQCSQCPRSFAYFEEIRSHLEDDHQVQVDTDVNSDARSFFDKGWLTLPADLRTLKCYACNIVLLCQDQTVLRDHMERCHPEHPVSEITYGCRSCSRRDFKSSREVFNHGCSNIRSRSSHSSCMADDVEPNESSDLRRLACRICSVQVNRTNFFAMIGHLEHEHDVLEFSSVDQLDNQYVRFGCGNCQAFSPNSVHIWDRHFVGSDCSKCLGMGENADKRRNKRY